MLSGYIRALNLKEDEPMRKALPLIAATLLLSACGDKPADNTAIADNALTNAEELPANEEPALEDAAANAGNASNAVALPADAWVGKWTGPEGLALEIAKLDTPGTYDIKITLLDGANSYRGTGEGETIRFVRGGVAETIRKASGDETGLKYLAGKTNCLMIKPAEGFCRG